MLADGAEPGLARLEGFLRVPDAALVSRGGCLGELGLELGDSLGELVGESLAASLALGMPLPDAIRRAAAAGAITVTRRGASPSLPHRDEVDALLATTAAS